MRLKSVIVGLVVVSVLGVWLGRAVQDARTAARRTQDK